MKHYLLAINWTEIQKAHDNDRWRFVRCLDISNGVAIGDYMKETGWHLYVFDRKSHRDNLARQTIDNEKATYSPRNEHVENMLAISQK